MKQPTAPLRLWRFLTRPHPSVTDIEQRRQSQLLASLIVSLLLTTLLASALLIVRNSGVVTPTVVFLWLAQSLTLVMYFLNRGGRYRLSAFMFVGFNFLLTFTMPVMTGDLAWLWFTNMVLILSAMLLPEFSVAIFFVGFVSHIVLGVLYPISSTDSNFTTTIVYSVIGPLVLVFMNHRTGLERERRQELQRANEALQRSEIELEKRVADRTRDLKVAADVSRQITTTLDSNTLLPQLAEKTKAAFDLYSVLVFIYQPDSQQLVLAAGTGEAGRLLKTEGRSFHIEARPSLNAKAARERQIVIINDVSQEPAHAYNPHLPETQSEAVFPMVVGDELIGVLNFQSEFKNRFEPDDVEIFSTLGEQIAIALKNAQLYEAQSRLAEELRQADQMKSQFLASMSHELRTPMNAIINFTEMVALGMMGPVNDKQIDLLNQSLESSRHLLNLINDVLDISKIQAGKLTLFVEDDVNLRQELKTVAGMVEPFLRNKPVKLIEDIDDDLPRIAGDKRRIRQILLNLLSNAAKFTDAGSVTLSAKNHGDRVLFAVIDTGPGIPSEMHKLIFEPFIQTSNGVKHAEGTGLGLPITRSLVEAHSGKLWLESEPGAGTAFYLTLPVAAHRVA